MSAHVSVHNLARTVYDALPAAEEQFNGTVWRTIKTKECEVTFFPEPVLAPSPQPAESEKDEIPF